MMSKYTIITQSPLYMQHNVSSYFSYIKLAQRKKTKIYTKYKKVRHRTYSENATIALQLP